MSDAQARVLTNLLREWCAECLDNRNATREDLMKALVTALSLQVVSIPSARLRKEYVRVLKTALEQSVEKVSSEVI